ncbi:dihydroneopterin aldolase [Rhizobium sp. S95]|uniref:7,8-dihydroneopterin aldolase n=1 Tax=Ciceribacter sichuanensis TaxID=2949647 RepID=A0AAJ1BUU0_9HYPH|nr:MULTISPECIES: dihydroneopterin aldolase [unclassified Ciceribacter]MCM2399245.1 dihydroneopterin aldolase [Ciceribacter sp. S95]MCO5956549.1 dihydroneopterin aldolase [Ciceribacter sp. S101]
MTDIYTITLKNCAFFARHGVYPEEEFLGQRFYVDAEFDVAGAEAAENDELDGTVDYGIVFKVIEEIVTTSRKLLIEALALTIAKELCVRFSPIKRARITVRKPSAPVPGILDYVQVSVEHFSK